MTTSDTEAPSTSALSPTAPATSGSSSTVRPGGNLPGLTGARWWAAAAVFLLHALVFLPTYPFQKSELFRTIHQNFLPMQFGATAVTFFFVLSGFIIYWSFRPGTSTVAFLRRRILKLYPTHLVAAAMFILVASVPLSRIVVWVPNVLLIHTWLPKWTTVGGLNVPSWSLATDLAFYLSFPLVLPLVQRIRVDRLLPWVIGLLAFIILMNVAYHFGLDGPTSTANPFVPRLVPGDVSPSTDLHASQAWFRQQDIPVVRSYWFSYNFPLSRLPEFFVGMIAARMVIEGRWRNTRLTLPLVALAVTYAATYVVPVSFKMSALVVGPMCALVATVAVRDMRGISGFTASRPIVWLGNVSYAFYLIQFPVMVLVSRLVIGGRRFGLLGWLGCTALCFVLSLVAAAAIYQWVDLPIMRRFAHVRPRKPVQQSA
ncbi:acyltransferase family protein [Nocardia sp. CWNU-33]|uniref:acyltransferase family protein n=1 Tax=Nocardia sp. CWNU-33 TaxID=3392117 RepID=UPI00398E9AF9